MMGVTPLDKKFKLEPQLVAEVKVQQMSNGELRVHRPEGQELPVIEILATAITIVSRSLAKKKASGIVAPPPGLKVN